MYKLLIIPFVLTISACAGYDDVGCLDSVLKKYPDDQVMPLAGERYRFIVKTQDGGVRYVKTMNQFGTEITTDILLIK